MKLALLQVLCLLGFILLGNSFVDAYHMPPWWIRRTTTTEEPTTTEAPFMCPPNAANTFADPTDCHNYILCVSGTQAVLTCRNGKYFDSNLKICRWCESYEPQLPDCFCYHGWNKEE